MAVTLLVALLMPRLYGVGCEAWSVEAVAGRIPAVLMISDQAGSLRPATAVNQSMQLGILHVAQDPCGVIKFAVVQISQCRDRLGIRR